MYFRTLDFAVFIPRHSSTHTHTRVTSSEFAAVYIKGFLESFGSSSILQNVRLCQGSNVHTGPYQQIRAGVPNWCFSVWGPRSSFQGAGA